MIRKGDLPDAESEILPGGLICRSRILLHTPRARVEDARRKAGYLGVRASDLGFIVLMAAALGVLALLRGYPHG